MEVIDTPNWETFEQKIKELRAEHKKESSPLLFRGQFRLASDNHTRTVRGWEHVVQRILSADLRKHRPRS